MPEGVSKDESMSCYGTSVRSKTMTDQGNRNVQLYGRAAWGLGLCNRRVFADESKCSSPVLMPRSQASLPTAEGTPTTLATRFPAPDADWTPQPYACGR